jgi:UDP-N-acetylmuramoylalanine--D-glutamate ligase
MLRQAWKSAATMSEAATLRDAVDLAAQGASPGDVVLLSPACASFDMFADYQDRGRQFKALVHALPA